MSSKTPPIGMKYCSKCKEAKPFSEFNKLRKAKDGLYPMCRKCHVAARLKYPRLDTNDYITRADKEQQEHIKQLVDMPLITEKEWIQTCRHFKKCALCREREITSKHYFIRFLKGGKCTQNNIVPLCSYCAKFCAREIPNMYYLRHKRIRRRYDNKRYKENTNVEQMIEYLMEVNNAAKKRI